jgi:hypothetical protein
MTTPNAKLACGPYEYPTTPPLAVHPHDEARVFKYFMHAQDAGWDFDKTWENIEICYQSLGAPSDWIGRQKPRARALWD